MAAVTICSDFGAQKNKISHCFHCFPIYLPWNNGTTWHDLSFLNAKLLLPYPLLLVCMLSCFSHVQLFATLWTKTCQAPLSLGFSRQEYWSEFPCPPGNLPYPGIEPSSLISPAYPLLILRKTRLPGFESGAKFFASKYRTLSRGQCFHFHLGPCYIEHFI